jgi:hypothetical protein
MRKEILKDVDEDVLHILHCVSGPYLLSSILKE